MYGSLARNEQLPYSDIDIECYTTSEESCETLFYYDGKLVTFYLVPFSDLFSDLSKSSSLIWYQRGFRDSKVLYDEKNWNSVVEERIERTFSDIKTVIENSQEDFNRQIRRFIEYRRKLNNALFNQEKIYAAHCAKNFVDSFLHFTYITNGISIKSERDLYTNFTLLNTEIVNNIEKALNLSSSLCEVKSSTDQIYSKGVEMLLSLK